MKRVDPRHLGYLQDISYCSRVTVVILLAPEVEKLVIKQDI